jgi:small subunit ribosomal protein S16
MLVIRLQRVGKKGQPSYRLAVSERRSKLTASPVEDLGSYSSITKTGTFNKERIEHWIKTGAHPTPTVNNLLVKHGVLARPIMKLGIPFVAKAEEPKAEAKPVEAKKEEVAEAKTEEAPKEEPKAEEAVVA